MRYKAFKLISIVLTMAFLWQPHLYAYYDALRPRAMGEKDEAGQKLPKEYEPLLEYKIYDRVQLLDILADLRLVVTKKKSFSDLPISR